MQNGKWNWLQFIRLHAYYFIGARAEGEKTYQTDRTTCAHAMTVQQIALNWTFAECNKMFDLLLCIILLIWKRYNLKCVQPKQNCRQKSHTNEKDKQLNSLLKIAWISIYWCKMLQYYILRYFCIRTHSMHTWVWAGIIYSHYSDSKVDQLLIGLYI